MTPCDIVKRKVTSGGVSGKRWGNLKYAAATVSPGFSAVGPRIVEDTLKGALRGEDATELPAENPPVL